MAVFSGPSVFLSVLLLIASSEVLALPRLSSYVSPAAIFPREDLNSPLCTPSCDFGTCGSGGSCSIASILRRRLLADSLFGNNSVYEDDNRFLNKRIFTLLADSQDPADVRTRPTKGQVAGYIEAQGEGQADVYFGLAGSLVTGDERAVSIQREFAANDQPFQIISDSMFGCTAIVLASTRAVWMTHLWESYSNGKNAKDENLDTAKDPAFKERVLMFLRGETVTNPSPNGWKDYMAPVGPGINADLFNNADTDQTKLYIFTPSKPNLSMDDSKLVANMKYPTRYGPGGEVVSAITDILGGQVPKLIIQIYKPLNSLRPGENARIGTGGYGAVLFQYDPAPTTAKKAEKAWRLFMETGFPIIQKWTPAT